MLQATTSCFIFILTFFYYGINFQFTVLMISFLSLQKINTKSFYWNKFNSFFVCLFFFCFLFFLQQLYSLIINEYERTNSLDFVAFFILVCCFKWSDLNHQKKAALLFPWLRLWNSCAFFFLLLLFFLFLIYCKENSYSSTRRRGYI